MEIADIKKNIIHDITNKVYDFIVAIGGVKGLIALGLNRESYFRIPFQLLFNEKCEYTNRYLNHNFIIYKNDLKDINVDTTTLKLYIQLFGSRALLKSRQVETLINMNNALKSPTFNEVFRKMEDNNPYNRIGKYYKMYCVTKDVYYKVISYDATEDTFVIEILDNDKLSWLKRTYKPTPCDYDCTAEEVVQIIKKHVKDLYDDGINENAEINKQILKFNLLLRRNKEIMNRLVDIENNINISNLNTILT